MAKAKERRAAAKARLGQRIATLDRELLRVTQELGMARRELDVFNAPRANDNPDVVIIPPSHDGRPLRIAARTRPEFFSEHQRIDDEAPYTILLFQKMAMVTQNGIRIQWFMPVERR